MAGCTAACGFCGRCTEEWERPSYQPAPQFCDRRTCGRDVVSPVSLAGLGVFCSRACASAEEAEFTERMKRRGFMQLQPDVLARASGE